MKKRIVRIVFLICLVFSVLLSSVSPVMAASEMSLEERGIVLPDSDVQLIGLTADGKVYAMVYLSGGYKLFRSDNQGRSWQKLAGQGLPEREKFISLKTAGTEVILATATKVFRLRDGGNRFEALGGPPLGQGEEITSLAVSAGSPPLVLVGVWNPAPGKFAQEGAYLWAGAEWQPQGMRRVWSGKSYDADVTSVAFLEGQFLAVATGDPEGPLPEGTYLNIAYQGQKGVFGIGLEWNYLSNWPIEISQTANQSAKEAEILNSKMVLSEFDWREGRIYIIYNTQTRQQGKDDAYRVELSEGYQLKAVRKLDLSKVSELTSLDSLDYLAGFGLAVGMTAVERRWEDNRIVSSTGAHVYFLSPAGENSYPPGWEEKPLRPNYDTSNCQVAISPDKAILVGTSGPASCFARSEQSNLVPISLVDVTSGSGISQLQASPRFAEDKTLFFDYGSKNIFKAKLDASYQSAEVQRLFYLHQGFASAQLRVSDQDLYFFETGTKRFWMNQGLIPLEVGVEITDAEVVDGKIWIAGRDGMVYFESGGRISSGLNWIGKIKPGPKGKVVVAGGSSEWRFESLSVVSGSSYQMLAPFPISISSSDGFRMAYSPKEGAVYCAVSNQLYRLPSLDAAKWEKVAEVSGQIVDLLLSSQGLYLFTYSQIYLGTFPVSQDSRWKTVAKGYSWRGCRVVGVDDQRNLLIFWDASKIKVLTHDTTSEVILEAGAQPLPSDFKLSDLQVTPAEVGIMEEVTTSVNVTNVGATKGVCGVILKMDGAVIAAKEVTLAAGESQKVSFSTTKAFAKTYTVTIGDLSGTFTVKSPSAAKVESVKPTSTPTPEVTKPEPVKPLPPTTEKSQGWLIPVLIAIVVIETLAIVVLVIRIRRLQF